MVIEIHSLQTEHLPYPMVMGGYAPDADQFI